MDNKNMITQQEIERCGDVLQKIRAYYYKKMVGQYRLGTALLVTIMCNGHILVESVPGLAKTTAAKTMTEAVNGSFSRIQCTPDLLPSDIIGTQILNYSNHTFETKLGPVYANFVLLDEINRSSAKTQSAMLEVMQEQQTTIAGKIYKMPEIFTVIATQNPIEQEGTYLLSEAQLDRFLIKEKLFYPTQDEEFEILNRIEKDVFSATESVVELEDVVFLQKMTQRVYIDDSIKRYIIAIIAATRKVGQFISPDLAKYVTMGASTRGGIALMEVAKAVALINGRSYVTPDDVRELIHSVLRHRITLNYAAVADGVKEEDIIDAIIGAVQTP
ncbi:MAG: MoxR family ATPase [Lachnospiraceae bacterium]|nr:MoxR family ATPase [Lachnospiraceae bacterium]MBQ8261554.1 MoxR family ATPase [Lachnospiraceae bacterium]